MGGLRVSVFLVSYDYGHLDSSDYDALVLSLEKYKRRLHALDSVWFIDTYHTHEEVYEDLKKHISKSDRLYVIHLHGLDGSDFLHKNACHTTWLTSPDRTWD